MSELLSAPDDWYRKMAKLEDGCDVSAGPAKPQPDDHTLNACLAGRIGLKHEIQSDGAVMRLDAGHEYDTFDPVHNPIEMEEVEAWLRENKWEYISGWNSQFNRHWAELRKGVKAFWTNDPDKKRAVALAVQAMEKAVAAEKEGTP